MECRKIENLIQRYIDGDLGPENQVSVKKHLEKCSSCRDKVLFCARFEEVTGSVEIQPPADFTQKVLGRLRGIKVQGALPDKAINPALRWGWAAALALIAVIVVPLSMKLTMPAADPLVTVRFEVETPQAGSVSVAGDFNDWNIHTCALARKNGHWKTTVKLKPGRYHYMFIIDGKEWIPDPGASEYVGDGYGGVNAVLDLLGEKYNIRKDV